MYYYWFLLLCCYRGSSGNTRSARMLLSDISCTHRAVSLEIPQSSYAFSMDFDGEVVESEAACCVLCLPFVSFDFMSETPPFFLCWET